MPRTPYEEAAAGGYLDEFQRATNEYYQNYPNDTEHNTNWYDRSSWQWLINDTNPAGTGGTGGTTTTPPPPDGSGTGGGGGGATSGGGTTGGGGATSGGGTTGGGNDWNSGFQPIPPQYNDPYTNQYEGISDTQLSLYSLQQQAMLRAAYEAEMRRRGTQGPALDRMQGYVNQRIGQLQGPAYTGAEGEVLRTQLLDPLERDRTAARQRALEQISARGMDPSSGVAHDLLRQVDMSFDQQRARVQGGLAKSQIEEQRGREQEAQQLLQYLAMLPDAIARGDLDFVSYVQSLIAQPGTQSLAVSGGLNEMGSGRLNDALATLGMSPSLSGAGSNAVQLLNQAQYARQQQQQQNARIWGSIFGGGGY